MVKSTIHVLGFKVDTKTIHSIWQYYYRNEIKKIKSKTPDDL